MQVVVVWHVVVAVVDRLAVVSVVRKGNGVGLESALVGLAWPLPFSRPSSYKLGRVFQKIDGQVSFEPKWLRLKV